ncbi:hypothetical protein ACHAWF_004453 [Thalassiosira exigua]
MTSTSEGAELDCEFGDVLIRLLTRIWNLHVTYPLRDIVNHANDVKSCFRQLKHHPDVMGAFSYILGHYLFLQCGLCFGADFSPASWEVIRRIAEQLATALFQGQVLEGQTPQISAQIVLEIKPGPQGGPLHPSSGLLPEQGCP